MRTWECPNCGRQNTTRVKACAHCGDERVVAGDSESTSCRGCKRAATRPDLYCPNRCSRCGDHSPSTTEFHPGDPEADPTDRGVRLCPSCWIPALRRRAEGRGPGTRCSEPGCGVPVEEHIAAARAVASSEAWRSRFATARESTGPAGRPADLTDDAMLALEARRAEELDRFRRHVGA